MSTVNISEINKEVTSSSRHGHSGSQSGFGLVQSDFGFSGYQNQPHSGYMKIRFGTGSGSIGFGSGLVNLQRTSTTRCTFGFGSQSVLWFKYT